MAPSDKSSRDFLSRAVKIAWLLVILEGLALLVAIYFIWAARADILASFHFG